MQVGGKHLSFDQFSHDLTHALEETSLGIGNRWGIRRRTRSTGNLPSRSQPTEEDSSSTDPNAPSNDNNNNDFANSAAVNSNSILSDSDDRQSYAFAFKLRQTSYLSGNFESDSLNENFSPSRPNIRRKRKFKRMAVEYETTPSTPQASAIPLFPISGTAKKRVFKHNQEKFRANLFFGKRKRPHRERYADYESYKHSSSVPRHRTGFLSQKDSGPSYFEYKSRNRASSMSTGNAGNNADKTLNVPSGAVNEKMLPLHKSIVSKIEKIPQSKMKFSFNAMTPFQHPIVNSPVVNFQSLFGGSSNMNHSGVFRSPMSSEMNTPMNVSDDTKLNLQNISRKSGSFESALPTSNYVNKLEHKKKVKHFPAGYQGNIAALHQKRKQNRRLKLQFDDQNFMDCGNINDFLSSSSLSSTDSETEETNESDHEGDDELTDWPGHEAMINFASKNEFKRANKKVKMPQIKQQEDITQDDDTLMSADEVQCQSVEASTMIPLSLQTPEFISPIDVPKFSNLSSRNQASHPINIIGTLGSSFIPSSSTSGVADGGYGSSLTTSYNHKQPIESEMSGETSNPFMASPAFGIGEVREIRAGCRRIREERPGFSIITSFNEDLLRFLQDEQQKQIKIYDIQEYDKILELAKLYSLHIQRENGCIVLNKTSNTMQAVRVSKEHNKYMFSDYKRRCVGGDTE